MRWELQLFAQKQVHRRKRLIRSNLKLGSLEDRGTAHRDKMHLDFVAITAAASRNSLGRRLVAGGVMARIHVAAFALEVDMLLTTLIMRSHSLTCIFTTVMVLKLTFLENCKITYCSIVHEMSVCHIHTNVWPGR